MLLTAAACLLLPASTFASGTYCACMPKPTKVGKTGKVKIDRDQYDLGQKVYNGKTATAQGNASAQRTRLQALQSRLPENVAKKKDLPSLAGKITDQQLEALDYYINHRYSTR